MGATFASSSGRLRGGPRPNVADGDAECARSTWLDAEQSLDHLPDGGLNIAHECVLRHAHHRPDHVALRLLRTDGGVEQVTYAQLADRVGRTAAVLRSLGVGRGDTVATLLGRVVETYEVALATVLLGAVFCPLYAAFGPEPVVQRLVRGDAAVLVTTAARHRRKVAAVRDRVPSLRHVLLVDQSPEPVEGTHHLGALRAAVPDDEVVRAAEPTSAEDPALLHFTSGTTGMPKGAVHVHGAVVAHHATGRTVLDLQPEDVYWCTADPGWVTGTSYGIVAPLAHGVTVVVDEAEIDPERWYRILEQQQVTVWYTAPTAIRMLRRAGDDLPAGFDLSQVRHVCSVGEPLDAEAVRWGADVLGLAIHDTWWQTETGAIMVAELPGSAIRPGSMGRPVPGIELALGARDEDGELRVEHGEPVLVQGQDEPGEILLRAGWPSMFRTYLHDAERYEQAFVGGWYRAGDLARRDHDGYLWFLGRADDLIKTAGHLVGPFEVERVLMEHPAVVEAAVIGVPDDVAGTVIKAYVTLGPGHEPGEEVRRQLVGFARARLGPAVAPRQLDFDQHLPHTRSGKIMRRLLRAQALGLPTGDLSTLERST